MGETEYWDEFVVYDDQGGMTGRVSGRIIFNESWDFTIFDKNLEARRIGLQWTAWESTPKEEFDIKADAKISPFGRYTRRLFKGKYVSARSAGNYLAGYNASTVKSNWGNYITREGFLKVAGHLHNSAGGPSPYYGEIPYATRWIERGITDGAAMRTWELYRKK